MHPIHPIHISPTPHPNQVSTSNATSQTPSPLQSPSSPYVESEADSHSDSGSMCYDPPNTVLKKLGMWYTQYTHYTHSTPYTHYRVQTAGDHWVELSEPTSNVLTTLQQIPLIVTLNATDAISRPLDYVIETLPTGGTLYALLNPTTVSATVAFPATGAKLQLGDAFSVSRILYRPDSNFKGVDSFAYSVRAYTGEKEAKGGKEGNEGNEGNEGKEGSYVPSMVPAIVVLEVHP